LGESARAWLLLVYTVPRTPTSSRVYVWRKLKLLGAVAIQDAAWVLPATDVTREQFRWIATEIEELKGQATLWESSLMRGADSRTLIKRFSEQTDAGYQKILSGLKTKRPDLTMLSKQFQTVRATDFFRSMLGQRARAELLRAKERLPRTAKRR
jgi:hypothetical protein